MTTIAEAIAEIGRKLEEKVPLELPEDTCIAKLKVAYWENEPPEPRICMKPREDMRHQSHYGNACKCEKPELHHKFVMGVRLRPKTKTLCDLWD